MEPLENKDAPKKRTGHGAEHLKEHQFKKGTSGNLKGRPVVNDIKRYIKERLAAPIRDAAEGEDPETVPIKLETIIQKLLTMANGGNLKALELALKYAYGNPTQALEVTGKDGQTLITHDFSKFSPEQLAEHLARIDELLAKHTVPPPGGEGQA